MTTILDKPPDAGEETLAPTHAQVLERLEAAALVLGDLPLHVPQVTRFDMRIWAEPLGDCGTAACAAGSLGLHPWFRARGLVTVVRDNYRSVGCGYTLKAFFGLSALDEHRLFYAREVNDPAVISRRFLAVLKRIRGRGVAS